jgi:hypothetical protein
MSRGSAVGTGTASDSERSDSLLAVYVDVEVEVANFRDAVLRPLAAARAKRIGSDIDVRAVVVLIAQPREIAGREHLLQPTMRCVVDAGFSLRSKRAIVSPGWKHRVRNSWAVCVFIAGVSQGWKPGVTGLPS